MSATLTRRRPPDTTDRRAERSLARPLRIGPASWLVPYRAALVTVAALAVLAVLTALDLSMGDFDIPLSAVVDTLFGGGDPGQQFIIRELRLPQTLVALLVGAALALSGALTQTFARNPLASPDILGVTEGAAVGAVSVIVLGGASGFGGGIVSGSLASLGLPAAAFAGGLGTAALLYALSWRRGIDGKRLVLVGIGLGACLSAVTSWLLVKARIQDAASAQVWLNGSLNARGWEHAWPLLVTLAVLVPIALLLVRSLNTLQLGDDNARALGLRLQSTQLLVLVVAVGLAAVAVSAVGPLEFVAFVAPQIALKLTGGSREPVLASMVIGAVVVVGADLVTRVVIPFSVPAGLVTAALGAPYLIWLLLRSNKKVTA